MISLDDLEKISKIAFSGIGACVLGYFTVTGKWNEFTLQEEKFCINTESYYMQAALRSETNPSEALLERIQKRCGFGSIHEARETFQAERAGYQQLASDQAAERSTSLGTGQSGTGTELGSVGIRNRDGWVALATIDAQGTISNFDQAGSDLSAVLNGTAPSAGTEITARWPVNLRENTEPTKGTINPSLAILDRGSCLKLTGETVKERSIIWAPVIRTPCS